MSAPQNAADQSTGRRQEIIETSARLICQRGYEATSMQQIAEACGLTKAGLYHYVATKEQILFEIMNYGMDLFEEKVLAHVQGIEDPLERLRETMRRNVLLVTQASSKEVTIILHEHLTLTGKSRTHINHRKREYVEFLVKAFTEAMEQGLIRKVNAKIAAFGFLGMVLWTYKWFRPDGALSSAGVADGMVDLLFNGLSRKK